MKTLIALILIAIVAKLVIDAIKKQSGEGGGGKSRGVAPYFGKVPVTEPEQVLYHRLREAMPESIVLAQVAMSALVGIRKNPARQAQFNEISRKYVDFVVCNADFSVKAIVELDDASHIKGDRIKADVIKDVAFQTIGVPVIRFDVREMPTVEQIKKTFPG